MAEDRRTEGDRPSTLSTPSTTTSSSTTSAGGIDPATHTIDTKPGIHTGRESGSSMAGQTGSEQTRTSTMTEHTEGKAGAMADKARQKASQLADKARRQASTQVSDQKQRVTESLSGISSALHQTSQNLRESNQDMIAGLMDNAAEYVEHLTDYLNNRSVGDLLDEAQRLARREPALFIGGAFVIGLLGARFLKSTSSSVHHRGEERYGGRSYYGGQSYRRQGYEERTQPVGYREGRYGSYVPGGVAGDYTRTHASDPHRSGTAAEEALGRSSSFRNPNEREEL